MQGEIKEPWRRLYEQASSEQDPDRLMLLVQGMEKLLREKEQCCSNGERKEELRIVHQSNSQVFKRHSRLPSCRSGCRTQVLSP